MAYRQTYIGKIYIITGKTTYLSNLKGLNGQKHHFTYYFLCKFNMYLQALMHIYVYLYLPLTVLPPKHTLTSQPHII